MVKERPRERPLLCAEGDEDLQGEQPNKLPLEPRSALPELPRVLTDFLGAQSIQEGLERGANIDTHRFLRLLSRLATGLSAKTDEALEAAKARLLAVPLWMQRLQRECGLRISTVRALCAVVVTFHRRGMTQDAFEAAEKIRAEGQEVPPAICALLVDLCIREGTHGLVPDLLAEATRAARQKIAEQQRLLQEEGLDPLAFKHGAFDGLPNWLSAREGQLLSLVSAHILALGGLWPLHNSCSEGSSTDVNDFVHRPPLDPLLTCRTVKEGLALLDEAVLAWADGLSESSRVSLEARRAVAQKLLVRPCMALPPEELLEICKSLQECETLRHEEAIERGPTFGSLSPSAVVEGCRAIRNVVRSLANTPRRPAREDVDELLRSLARHRATTPEVLWAALEALKVLAASGEAGLRKELARALAARQSAQEEAALMAPSGNSAPSRPAAEVHEGSLSLPESSCDGASSKLEAMEEDWHDSAEAELHTKHGGALQEEGDEAGASSEDGEQDLPEVDLARSNSHDTDDEGEQVEPANLHLLPDAEVIAAAIEALYATGGSKYAEILFAQCRRNLLPTPAVYTAVIFGRIGQGDGDGATETLLEMDRAGFVPHQRFLQRVLRLMGSNHLSGLRVIQELGCGPEASMARLYHTLMESCWSCSEASRRALEVCNAMTSTGLRPNLETEFAFLKVLSGLKDMEEAHEGLVRLQEQGHLKQHPAFEALLRECFMVTERKRQVFPFIDTRRIWFRRAMELLPDNVLPDVVAACKTAVASEAAGAWWQPPRPSTLCAWMPAAYIMSLPLVCAAVHTAQPLVWRYHLIRSASSKEELQAELDALYKIFEWQRFGPEGQQQLFSLHILLQLHTLEVPEGAQLRLLRMLLAAGAQSGARWRSDDAMLVEEHAATLLPEVLSELMQWCKSSSNGGCVPFSSEEGHRRLLHLVEQQYLKRTSGECIRLSTTIRFVRTHGLVKHLADDVLLKPVLNSFVGGFMQHAFSLCEADADTQRRLVAYAMRRNMRRAAGRLAERFQTLTSVEAPPGWEADEFREACLACVKEAEEAEERELRDANEKRIAAEDDSGCMQLPAHLQSNVLFVATIEDLDIAVAALQEACRQADQPALLGLDVEWRPGLEKRGGMQKHRRSAQVVASLEPCSTLQLAVDKYIAVLDLYKVASATAGSLAEAFSSKIGALMDDEKIVKLGFGIQHDLQRLATSYPHLKCFRHIRPVLDVQDAWHRCHGGKCPSGLSALCSQYLGAPLSKRLQTSDWGQRPLSHEQVSYAALDALCLLGLARALPCGLQPLHSLEVTATNSGQLLAQSVADGNRVPLNDEEVTIVEEKIVSKGAEIRAMKAQGATKAAVQAEVAILNQLKACFKELTNVEWVPPVAPACK